MKASRSHKRRWLLGRYDRARAMKHSRQATITLAFRLPAYSPWATHAILMAP